MLSSHSSPAAKKCESPPDDGTPGNAEKICFIKLIAEALMASPDKKLTLRDIYVYAANKHPSLLSSNTAWKNSIRFRLSTNDCFIKGKTCGNRGSYWYINTEYIEEIKKGEYKVNYNRKRFYGRTKGKSQKTSSFGSNDEYSSSGDTVTNAPTKRRANDHFVFQADKINLKTIRDVELESKSTSRPRRVQSVDQPREVEPEYQLGYIRDACLDEFNPRYTLKTTSLPTCGVYGDQWSNGPSDDAIPLYSDDPLMRREDILSSNQPYAMEMAPYNSNYAIDIRPASCTSDHVANSQYSTPHNGFSNQCNSYVKQEEFTKSSEHSISNNGFDNLCNPYVKHEEFTNSKEHLKSNSGINNQRNPYIKREEYGSQCSSYDGVSAMTDIVPGGQIQWLDSTRWGGDMGLHKQVTKCEFGTENELSQENANSEQKLWRPFGNQVPQAVSGVSDSQSGSDGYYNNSYYHSNPHNYDSMSGPYQWYTDRGALYPQGYAS